MKKAERDRDHADLVKYNRKLIRSIITRDRRAKQYDEAQKELVTNRRMVRTLIDRLREAPLPEHPICDECGLTLGQNPACAVCKAANEIETRGAYAHPENP